MNMRWFFLIGLLFLAGCATSEGRFPILAEAPAGSGQRILVTFVDRSIDRHVPGNPTDGYRMRGLYDNSAWSRRVSTELAERYGLRLMAQWPVTALGLACVVYEIPKNHSAEEVISTLEKDKEVGKVQTMRDYRVLGSPSPAASGYNDPYLTLQKDFQSLRFEQAHLLATGKGVRIAVIDTGVDSRHPDLLGHIKAEENLAPMPAGVDLADVHGTAVAGVLAAQPGNGIGIAGIAPGADIYSLRACWPEATGAAAARCNSFTLALALNEAIRLHSDIINMSLTGPNDPLVRALVEEAIKQKIIVVAAVPKQAEAGGFPADVPGVFAVANSASPDSASLLAPGQDVLTTLPHGAYDFMSGSSFAAPHVAGLIAMLLELQPHMDAVTLRHLLKDKHPGSPLDAVTALAALR